MMKYGLLTIEQIRELELPVLMYRYHKNLLPYEIQNLFETNNSQIKTRSNSQIIKNLCKYTTSQQSIKFAGPKSWIKIPKNIQNCSFTKAFVKNMKKYIVSIQKSDD